MPNMGDGFDSVVGFCVRVRHNVLGLDAKIHKGTVTGFDFQRIIQIHRRVVIIRNTHCDVVAAFGNIRKTNSLVCLRVGRDDRILGGGIFAIIFGYADRAAGNGGFYFFALSIAVDILKQQNTDFGCAGKWRGGWR